MADRDPLDCLDWAPSTTGPDIAICGHDGCPWESTAKTLVVQLEAYLEHHERRHHQEHHAPRCHKAHDRKEVMPNV